MKNKKALAALAVLLFLVVVAVACWLGFRTETSKDLKNITVEITHKDGATNEYVIATQEEYLYGALDEEDLIGEITDGYFVTLDGETADGSNEEWWGYTKSGEYVNYGVTQCAISDGDHYEFTLNVGW